MEFQSLIVYPNDCAGKISYLIDSGIIRKGMKVLEIGAGNDRVKKILQKHSVDVTSTDKRAARNLKVFDAENDELSEDYDMILGLGVLHHLKDPMGCCRKLIKNSDEMVFIEPDMRSIIHWLLVLMPRENRRLIFFSQKFSGKRALFVSKRFGITVPQTVIRYRKGAKGGLIPL